MPFFVRQKIPWITLALGLLCIGLYVLVPFGSPLFGQLTLLKSASLEPVRWLTGNLLHSDWNHLLWNTVALLVLGSSIERYSRLLWWLTSSVTFAAIAVWFFIQTQFQQYVGLSGALNGFLLVALYSLRIPGHWFRRNELLWLVLVLAVAKNLYEFFSGSALISETRWPSTPSFHMVGMLAGVLVIAAWKYRSVAKKAAD